MNHRMFVLANTWQDFFDEFYIKITSEFLLTTGMLIPTSQLNPKAKGMVILLQSFDVVVFLFSKRKYPKWFGLEQ